MANTAVVTVTGTALAPVLIERSLDGATWTPVRPLAGAPLGFTGLMGSGGTLSFADPEGFAGAITAAALPTSLLYRAVIGDGAGHVSAPSAAATVTPTVVSWSLVAATPGQTAATACRVVTHVQTRVNREAAHIRMGASDPVVVTDVVGARTGTLEIVTTAQAEVNAILDLLAQMTVLFLVSPYADILYLRADPSGTDTTISPSSAGSPYRVVKIGYLEVAQP